MKVAVAYAEAKQQVVIDTEMEVGGTVEQAITKSGILKKFAGLDLTKCKTGIYGKIVPAGQVLSEGDRVEIYRPAIGKPPKKGSAAAKGVDATDDATGEED
ncbi:MAG: RnfH family protein [Magnetococcus sp. DMHC-8]